MLLHRYFHNPLTEANEVLHREADAHDAEDFLPLDRPVILILPGTGQDDPGKDVEGTIGKIRRMIYPHKTEDLSTVSLESEPHYALFTWHFSGNRGTVEAIRQSTENNYTFSKDATLLAETLWKSVCHQAGTSSPSKEQVISTLSKLTIFAHSYGSLFGEEFSAAFGTLLAGQPHRPFSDNDVKDILHAIVQVNIAALTNLATKGKKTFLEYNFCAINDPQALSTIASAIDVEHYPEGFQATKQVAHDIGYPTESWLTDINKKRLGQDSICIRQMPCGVIVSDHVDNRPGRVHAARTQTNRSTGFGDIFGRLIAHALHRLEPFPDKLAPLLTPVPEVEDSNQLLTERIKAGIARGEGRSY